MNFLISLAAKAISQRIEEGSSRGAKIGTAVGAGLLGGVAGLGWATDVTGFMGAGLTLAGVLGGGIAGAMIGAGRGPEDRLIHREGQHAICVNDYNRKLAPLAPMLLCLFFGGGALYGWMDVRSKPTFNPGDAGNLMAVTILCATAFVGLGVYLAMRDLSVTFAEKIRVNRMFNHYEYDYAAVAFWAIGSVNQHQPPFPAEVKLAFVMRLPDRQLAMPLKQRQADELFYLLDELVPNETRDG